MHPLYDLRELSDQEISARIDRVRQYHNLQTGFGRTAAIDSASLILESLYNEQDRRRAELIKTPEGPAQGVIELGKIDD